MPTMSDLFFFKFAGHLHSKELFDRVHVQCVEAEEPMNCHPLYLCVCVRLLVYE